MENNEERGRRGEGGRIRKKEGGREEERENQEEGRRRERRGREEERGRGEWAVSSPYCERREETWTKEGGVNTQQVSEKIVHQASSVHHSVSVREGFKKTKR